MRLLSRIRKKLLYMKQYLGRTVAYIGLINAGMLLFLFLTKLKESGTISFEIDKYIVPLVFLGLIILIFIGWFDVHVLRGMQEENIISFELNPRLVIMDEKINQINNKLVRLGELNEK